jgi:hypothetical protein
MSLEPKRVEMLRCWQTIGNLIFHSSSLRVFAPWAVNRRVGRLIFSHVHAPGENDGAPAARLSIAREACLALRPRSPRCVGVHGLCHVEPSKDADLQNAPALPAHFPTRALWLVTRPAMAGHSSLASPDA